MLNYLKELTHHQLKITYVIIPYGQKFKNCMEYIYYTFKIHLFYIVKLTFNMLI